MYLNRRLAGYVNVQTFKELCSNRRPGFVLSTLTEASYYIRKIFIVDVWTIYFVWYYRRTNDILCEKTLGVFINMMSVQTFYIMHRANT